MGENLTMLVCIGSTCFNRRRDLGCGPGWLPVTVKCFPAWKHWSHLFGQVRRLKRLPVWQCLDPNVFFTSFPSFRNYFLLPFPPLWSSSTSVHSFDCKQTQTLIWSLLVSCRSCCLSIWWRRRAAFSSTASTWKWTRISRALESGTRGWPMGFSSTRSWGSCKISKDFVSLLGCSHAQAAVKVTREREEK